jgi:hypothetical protein
VFSTKDKIIFCGNFGSGKTEISINYVLELAKRGVKAALVDLDIVNPFFRSRDEKCLLESKGVTVISSSILSKGADLPALSPHILGLIQEKNSKVVFDLGGDDIGSKILGRFKNDLEDNYELFFVINVFRPFTNNKEGIIQSLYSIEKASGLKITGLVNNSNLGTESDIGHLIKGKELLNQIKEELNIEIKFHCLKEDLLDLVKEYNIKEPIFPLKRYMVPIWEK